MLKVIILLGLVTGAISDKSNELDFLTSDELDGLVTGSISGFDNPNDITSVELKIQIVSGISPTMIYANGRHQIPIQIIAKAKQGDEEKVLNFSHKTWVHILNLRFAESDKKLNWRGSNGWCYTYEDNDYSRELVSPHSKRRKRSNENTASKIMIFYVYTDEVSSKRIAVSIDTDNGKHFTTADNASGAEKMSITVIALQEIDYHRDDLIITRIRSYREAENKVEYSWGEINRFKSYYENYYITVRNGIQNADTHNYLGSDGGKPWIALHDFRGKNQYMIVAHPFNKKGTGTFGFKNTAHWDAYSGTFDLTQSVTYNEKKKHICFTHMTFNTEELRGSGSHMDQNAFIFLGYTWFDLYDIYGNYGKFSVRFSGDTKSIDIVDR